MKWGMSIKLESTTTFHISGLLVFIQTILDAYQTNVQKVHAARSKSIWSKLHVCIDLNNFFLRVILNFQISEEDTFL